MVRQRWDDTKLNRHVDQEAVKLLERLGIRGTTIAKQVITGSPDPQLRAIDKGDLRASIAWKVFPQKLMVRIGVFRGSATGRALEYAIFVFLGTAKMIARPVLRMMLHILRAELRGR